MIPITHESRSQFSWHDAGRATLEFGNARNSARERRAKDFSRDLLPNLIVIGAMKAGTTSLHVYLSLHPEIFMSADKEPRFFNEEWNWHRGLEWYEAQFPERAAIRGESTPDYTKFPAMRNVPERIHSVIPDARLIYLVRDPIDRIVSHYVDAYSFGRVHGTLEDELAHFEDCHFVNCSRYYLQLEQYLEYFDPGSILVLVSEELRNDRQRTLQTAFRFLGVEESFAAPEWETTHYGGEDLRRKTRIGYGLLRLAEVVRSSPMRRYLPRQLMAPIRAFNALTARRIQRPTMDESLRAELAEYLREDVDKLRRFTGQQFESWSV
jgi:sulfotransferase family protein